MSLTSWIELIAVVVLGTLGQLALKYALRGAAEHEEDDLSLSRLVASPLMWVWFVSYAATTVLWLVALRTVPLSQAFPILGLQFALIPLASHRLLDEEITSAQWLGIAVIVAGVALVGQT